MFPRFLGRRKASLGGELDSFLGHGVEVKDVVFLTEDFRDVDQVCVVIHNEVDSVRILGAWRLGVVMITDSFGDLFLDFVGCVASIDQM